LADACLISRVKEIFVNAMYIANPYGLTETGLSVFGKHPDGIPIPFGSAGHPTPSVRIKLVDDVLYVKVEDMLSRIEDNDEEYFNTRDRFTVDAQGFYYYAGRADDMLKCGGEKVFPIEIESVLKQHPSVIDSVVIGLEDDIKGQKPYAFVKLSNPMDETYLLSYVSSMLASYQIPKRIWQLDNFPINEIGKIDKKNLKHLAEQYILDKG
jgi:acyl-coenzyme A synthetase/AMP-(fatty) acid ligase